MNKKAGSRHHKADLAFGGAAVLTIALLYGAYGISLFYVASCHAGEHESDCHQLDMIMRALFAAAALSALFGCMLLERFVRSLYMRKKLDRKENPFGGYGRMAGIAAIFICTSGYCEVHYNTLCSDGSHTGGCDSLRFYKQFGATVGAIWVAMAATRFIWALRRLAESS